jgi:hypothetical protein
VAFKLLFGVSVLFLSWSALAAPGKQTKAAPAGRRYAIAEITFDGPVSAEDRKTLEANIPGTVALIINQEGGELIDYEPIKKALEAHPELRGCSNDKCSLRLGDLVNANRLLTIRVERTEDSPTQWKWQVRILNFAVDQAQVVGATQVPCVQCKVDDLVHDLSNSFQPVFNADTPKSLCKLSVGSLPPGAAVSIDTVELGETPFEHTLAAGRHTIAVDRERFARGQAEIDCKPRAGMDITFTLDSKQTTSATKDVDLSGQKLFPADNGTIQVPPPSKGLRIAGGTLLGVGAAAVIAGAVLVAKNHDGTCTLTGSQTQCPERLATLVPGAVTIGLGAAAIVGGVIALVVDHQHREKLARAPHPSVQASSNSFLLGLEGGF